MSAAPVGSRPSAPTWPTSLRSGDYELRFAVNYLAGFLLTLELLPLLRASAPARIVYVASIGQHRLDFTDLMLTRGYTGTRAYGQSKLAQIMSGFELAGRISATEVTVNSLHPPPTCPPRSSWPRSARASTACRPASPPPTGWSAIRDWTA
jgi:NAD(P)-dependent dehydrogenase (short-subunit alcohol dehydrogenase family)